MSTEQIEATQASGAVTGPGRAPFSGYFQRDIPAEDAELTHVEPGTPGGEYLRRFWQPVAIGDEVTDLPVRVRVLGEDLVVFRSGDGRVGLLALHCMHRGVSLEFGRVEECGLRCCYHGWLFGHDGEVVEMPPRGSGRGLYHGAYPVVERCGLIFAYLGPPDTLPPLPEFDFFGRFPGHRTFVAGKTTMPCNWLQVKENIMDPIHTVWLHAYISKQFSAWHAAPPHLGGGRTPLGTKVVATRQVDPEHIVTRVHEWVLPNVHQFSGTLSTPDIPTHSVRAPACTKWAVPEDSTSTVTFRLIHIPEALLAGLSDDEVTALVDRAIAEENLGEEPAGDYEQQQRTPGDYEAQVSQRPIAVHALEHLVATDRWVLMARKLLREEIRTVAAGGSPTIGFVSVDDGEAPRATLTHQRVVVTPGDGSIATERVTNAMLAVSSRPIGAGPVTVEELERSGAEALDGQRQ